MRCQFTMQDWRRRTGHRRFSLAAWKALSGLKRFTLPAWCDFLEQGAGGGASYTASAVHFDGDAMLSIASLACTDNEFCSFSLWLKRPLADPNPLWMTDPNGTAAPEFAAVTGTPKPLLFMVQDLAGDNTLSARITNPSADWSHILGSCRTNLSAGNKIIKLYQNDVDVTNEIDDEDDSFSIAINGRDVYVGGDIFGQLAGDMADFWLAPGQSLLTGSDIAEATRRKFISAAGKPVYLGESGELPTGTPPAVFFSGDSTGFVTNRGTGGGFTLIDGPLTNASTSPSN